MLAVVWLLIAGATCARADGVDDLNTAYKVTSQVDYFFSSIQGDFGRLDFPKWWFPQRVDISDHGQRIMVLVADYQTQAQYLEIFSASDPTKRLRISDVVGTIHSPCISGNGMRVAFLANGKVWTAEIPDLDEQPVLNSTPGYGHWLSMSRNGKRFITGHAEPQDEAHLYTAQTSIEPGKGAPTLGFSDITPGEMLPVYDEYRRDYTYLHGRVRIADDGSFICSRTHYKYNSGEQSQTEETNAWFVKGGAAHLLPNPANDVAYAAAISRDGKRILVHRRTGSLEENSFDLFNTESAPQKILTIAHDSNLGDIASRWISAYLAPDGRYLMLTGYGSNGTATAIFDSHTSALKEVVAPVYLDTVGGVTYDEQHALVGGTIYADDLAGTGLTESSDSSFEPAECEDGKCNTTRDRAGRERGLPPWRDPNRSPRQPRFPKAACKESDSQRAGDMISRDVNLNTGRVFLEAVDMGWTARGKNIVLERSYNTAMTGGPLGKGWSHGFQRRLEHKPDNTLIEYDARGVPLHLLPDGEQIWTAPGLPVTARLTEDGWSVFYKLGSSYHYTVEGWLRQVRDSNGNTTELTYNAGELTGITDSAGRTATFTSSGGLLRSITGPGGHTVQFAYTSDARLAVVTDARGQATSYTYDDQTGAVLSVHNPAGDSVQYEYLSQPPMRVSTIHEVSAGGRDSVSHLEYPSATQRRFVDAMGAVTTYELDDRGRETSRTNALGQTIVTERTDQGAISASFDPEDREHTMRTWDYIRDKLVGSSTWNGIESQLIYSLGEIQAPSFAGPQPGDEDYISPTPLGVMGRDRIPTWLEYDEHGNLKKTTDPLNRTTTIDRRTDGQPSSITDAAGRVVAVLGYDANGNVQSITDADGKTSTYSSDALGRALNTTSAGGRSSSVTYEGSGYLTNTLVNALGHTTSKTFDANARVTSITRPSGATINYTRDRINGKECILTVTNADGGVTTSEYDARGDLISMSDPLQRVTTWSRDALGRTTSVALPDGTTQAIRYTRSDQVAEIQNARGAVTHIDYNGDFQPERVISPDGSRTEMYYDWNRRPNYTTYPDSGSISVAYDDAGQPTMRIDPMSFVRRAEFTSTGMVSRSIDERDKSTRYFYDDLDRLIRTKDPLGRITHYAYGPDSELKKVETPGGNAWTYTYDPMRRVKVSHDPAGAETRVVYDEDGRVTALINENGQRWSFVYDAVGRLTREKDPADRVVVHHYNAAGEEFRRNFPDGSSWLFIRDARGRITQRRMKRAGGAVEQIERFTYDSVGNRTVAENDAAKITSEFDIMDREVKRTTLFKATQATRVLNITYDVMGRRQMVTDTHGRIIQYTYDLKSRPTQLSITEPATWATGLPGFLVTRNYTLTWDRTSNLTKLRHPNKTRLVNTYDNAGQLEKRSYLLGANEEEQVLSSFDYQHDADGRITHITRETGLAYEYSYDSLGRLINAKLPSDLASRLRAADGPVPTDPDAAAAYNIRRILTGADVSYQYDPAGNRTQVSSDGGTLTATYSPNNELLAQGGITYSYDTRGFQTAATYPTGALRAFDYDAAGRLSAVRAGANAGALANIQLNSFDPNSRRVTQWDFATNRTSHTLWDGLMPIDTFWAGPTAGTERGIAMFSAGDGATEQRPYVRATNSTRAPINSDGWAEYAGLNQKSQFEWMFTDHLGSTAAFANYAGVVSGGLAHGAWGEALEGAFNKSSMTYAGTQRDGGTGLQYAWHRFYDPTQARWVSRDPIGFQGGVHLYAYASSNPIGRVDPTGLLVEPVTDPVLTQALGLINGFGPTRSYFESLKLDENIIVQFRNNPGQLGNVSGEVSYFKRKPKSLSEENDESLGVKHGSTAEARDHYEACRKKLKDPLYAIVDIYTGQIPRILRFTDGAGGAPRTTLSPAQWVAQVLSHELWHANTRLPDPLDANKKEDHNAGGWGFAKDFSTFMGWDPEPYVQ